MTNQYQSRAAIRTTALVFAALCCSATALAAVAPLAFSPDEATFNVRTRVADASTTARGAGNPMERNANA
jgi:hypothetical protein